MVARRVGFCRLRRFRHSGSTRRPHSLRGRPPLTVVFVDARRAVVWPAGGKGDRRDCFATKKHKKHKKSGLTTVPYLLFCGGNRSSTAMDHPDTAGSASAVSPL